LASNKVYTEANDELSLEEILGSKVRIRILKTLFKLGEANITRIARETNTHFSLVEKHLQKLKEIGIVEEKRIGRTRLFGLNYGNPKVHLLIELIRSVEGT